MELTKMDLSPADAGMRISAEQYASARTHVPYIYERVQGRLVVNSNSNPQRNQRLRRTLAALGRIYNSTAPRLESITV